MAEQTAVDWITESQAQAETGRARRTLQRWRQSGEVRAHQQSRTLTLYEAASLAECAKRHKRRHASTVGRPRTT
ncbi:hypothetical protein [Rhodococcus sp. NBC_00297]|uniref:hypothetical protein n=1 Tax=Rhodococcus sp. NBC_00297 TaxID=2976005 RepID=UPI002E2B5D69|nr:hypothetical protein [Rhodococcus sp. NBC_00297]